MSTAVNCPKCGKSQSLKLIEPKLIKGKLNEDIAQSLKKSCNIISKIGASVKKMNYCSSFVSASTKLAGIILGETCDYLGKSFAKEKYYCNECDYTFTIETKIDSK